MNPQEFLEVADDLAAGLREGDWRSAVSRAYYAAFHVARELLSRSGFAVPRGEQAHAYLWLRLSNSAHPDVDQAGADLRELRSKRNWADYDLAYPLTQNEAFDFVQLGRDIIRVLELLPTIPAVLTAVVDAMKVYERDILKQVTWHP